MDSYTVAFIAILISLVVYCVSKVKKRYKYWKSKGVPQIDFNIKKTIAFFREIPVYAGLWDMYKTLPDAKIIGSYAFWKPQLLVKDPDFIEKILIKDFQYFVDRQEANPDKGTMMNLALFALTGNEWRCMRSKISPTFTTGKLKAMLEQMDVCAESFRNEVANTGSDVEMSEAIKSYAMDVSSTVIFGIELKDKKLREEFKINSDAIFSSISLFKLIIIFAFTKFPRIAALFGLRFMSRKVESFFRNLVEQTLEQRKSSKIQKNDYVQLLLNLKEKGYIEMKHHDPDDSYLKDNETPVSDNFTISDDSLAAQAFSFLTAGFDPIQNTILFLFYEISLNEKIQDRLREEIVKAVETGGYTYQNLKNMTYLDQCIQECLRKYPVATVLARICVKDYKYDERLTIEKGTPLMISLLGLHRDPKYFPDPDKFDPERFNGDTVIRNGTYLPFGDGPRVCIAMRFAMMEMKLAVAKILEKHAVSLSPKAKVPVELDSKKFFITPINLYFNISAI